MSKIYRKYIKNEDHVWYDSSNIVYSVCLDKGETKPVKIVFKGGRTYIYHDVSTIDYVLFRDAVSNGSVFSSHIKKYECTKVDDTDLVKLEELKQNFIKSDNCDKYEISLNSNTDTGEYQIVVNGNVVFEGVEGEPTSIINILQSIGIPFTMVESNHHNQSVATFIEKSIIN